MYVSEFGCQQFEKRYELHRTIMRAFPKTLGNNERVLFRLDANERSVLVQSVGLPDWLWFPGRVTVKEFQPQFQIGRMHCFQLHANNKLLRDIPEESGVISVDAPPSLVGWTPPYWRSDLFTAGWPTGTPVRQDSESHGSRTLAD